MRACAICACLRAFMPPVEDNHAAVYFDNDAGYYHSVFLEHYREVLEHYGVKLVNQERSALDLCT